MDLFGGGDGSGIDPGHTSFRIVKFASLVSEIAVAANLP